MTTVMMEKITEALERVKPKGNSRSHMSTVQERHLTDALAATGGFDTIDLITAILEVDGLGADLEERRRIAKALGWPVYAAMQVRQSQGFKQGFAACEAQVQRRLFG